MGIRYYAYPITAEDYPRALENPCAFHGADPLMDAWGPIAEQPEMLYLDKCWRHLQVLLGPTTEGERRPASRLVEGDVTMTGEGWLPHEQVLSPAEVREIAVDLAVVGEAHVRDAMPDLPSWDRDGSEEFDYVMEYLAKAQEFTAALARTGRGLIYLIG